MTRPASEGPSPVPHPFRSDPDASHPARVLPSELPGWLAGPEPPLLLDVRSREEREIVHLVGDRWIPIDELPARARELPADRAVIVYCHYGGTAARAAKYLGGAGLHRVALLEGGLDEYARVVDPTVPRYADPPRAGPVLQQFPNLRTGCLAYVLSDPVSNEAVVIDPGVDTEPYERALAARGRRLTGIVETHTHADHRSGHAALHDRTGAPIWLSHRSPAQYPHRTLTEGEAVRFGGQELVVHETPGHTIDHLSLTVGTAVFTGDTLLPGSCGRTDLGGGSAEKLWESLTGTLLRLPDEMEVFPAHYGARHGLPPPERYASTIGFERRTNEALRQPSRESFVLYMADGWPPKPPDFDRIVQENLTH